MARFFVDRPIFATVLSIVVVVLGLVAGSRLPIAQYPEVVPPTVSVTCTYPGANAATVAETVATPIETEVNGVENMLYMSSKCTGTGSMTLDVTFKLGTNLDTAQVLVQNRVAIALPKLPEEVQRQGVVTKKKSPDILLVVNLNSPDGTRDSLYLSNYAALQVKDALARIHGVGDVVLFGAREYSLRVWLDPEQLAIRSLNAGDVLAALREQNVQVAAGRLGQPPTPAGQELQLALNAQGRLIEERDFREIVIRTGAEGQIVRLRDVARVELGAKSYDSSIKLDGRESVGLPIYLLPGSNALETANAIKRTMQRLKKDFPPGVDYSIVYDTTTFIEESVASVYHTLFEAFLLVFVVVLVFLQDWRATILPMIDVPVSLIGTLAAMAMFGFTLNNLTLFGLVLAIGIVVDDAIVVVENVERWMSRGLDAREATLKAMAEITGPIIAITLVLASVFVPTVFIAGIPGQFFRQFALTIAASTAISAMNAMTMTPSRAAQIFKNRKPGHGHGEALPWWGTAAIAGWAAVAYLGDRVFPLVGVHVSHKETEAGVDYRLWGARIALFAAGAVVGWLLAKPVNRVLGILFGWFNHAFDLVTRLYGRLVAGALRVSIIGLILYGGLMGWTAFGFSRVPVGFIPEQDKGYFVVLAQLPDGASLARTEALMEQVTQKVLKTPGVTHAISVPGFSVLAGANLPNAATMFVTLEPFEQRVRRAGVSGPEILGSLRKELGAMQEALVLAFGPPPVNGLGSNGGFKLWVEDRRGWGLPALQGAVDQLAERTGSQPGFVGMFSTFRVSEPQIYLEIDRSKAKSSGVALTDVFDTLRGYLGSAYVNDFTRFGRNWQVNVQADAKSRLKREDVAALKVRNSNGDMVPLGSIVELKDVSGPSLVSHYQLYPAADLNGTALPFVSSGQAIDTIDALSAELPPGFAIEWTDLAYQQIAAGEDLLTRWVFPLGVVFVFLVLAAQYESWSLPFAIVLIVPMCLSSALVGLMAAGSNNNIFTQIGLLVLIGLASKNAILIVEFAQQLRNEGKSRREALIDACTLRLRPIVMTSLAFILGVVPLVRAEGAGYEMRRALGIAVFSGMIGVTIFGLFFTPIFYWTLTWFGDRGKVKAEKAEGATPAAS